MFNQNQFFQEADTQGSVYEFSPSPRTQEFRCQEKVVTTNKVKEKERIHNKEALKGNNYLKWTTRVHRKWKPSSLLGKRAIGMEIK